MKASKSRARRSPEIPPQNESQCRVRYGISRRKDPKEAQRLTRESTA